MKYSIFVLLFLMVSFFSVAQNRLEYGTPNYLNQKLDRSKFKECELFIPINYIDAEEDFAVAKKYHSIEIVILSVKGKKIKGYIRGYIEVDENGIYFRPLGEHISVKRMENVLFMDERMLFYEADCFDGKNK
ncbi:hypothetical protein [Fulvivirga kasyanovii]|uniref:Pilus assembly protein PilP n=1 Tax=Fulvivirga kasyanovii TaxID=396812 RepID=A0ABW9RL46_9BACT|nr:hypothetical protein [Fulvivirga kasyanovii]MTI24824.1 hypothetical protein [Fulvivirga kasyanovii]